MKRYFYENKKTKEKIQSDELLNDKEFKLLKVFLTKPVTKYYTK